MPYSKWCASFEERCAPHQERPAGCQGQEGHASNAMFALKMLNKRSLNGRLIYAGIHIKNMHMQRPPIACSIVSVREIETWWLIYFFISICQLAGLRVDLSFAMFLGDVEPH
jgi:hypothetical protein